MKAVDKMVDPPMKAPPEARGVRLSILPAEVSYVGDRRGGEGFSPVHEVNFRVDLMEIKQDKVRGRIGAHYLVPLFNMFANLDRAQITAREIIERQAEKVQQLGPTLTRTNHQLLEPAIDITFYFMLQQGMIPPPPKEIQGVTLRVEFVSVLAVAQKLSSFQSIENFVVFLTQLSQVKPEALDILDVDEAVRDVAEIFGVPPDVLFSDEQIAEMRQLRAAAQMRAAQAEQVATAAAAAKDLSASSLDSNNALGRLVELNNAGALAQTA
jgi:hypothetical protein